MNWRLVCVVLVVTSIGLGVWAVRAANRRYGCSIRVESGPEAIRSVERAKKDRDVEIVVTRGKGGAVTQKAVPRNELDDYVRAHRDVAVRVWMSDEAASELYSSLAASSRFDDGFGEMARQANDHVRRRKAATAGLAVASAVAGLGAVACGYVAVRGSTETPRGDTTGPAEASSPSGK